MFRQVLLRALLQFPIRTIRQLTPPQYDSILMTNSAVTGGIVIANALAVVSIATATELNPILECIQNGASVGAIMGIFLWREVKRAERYEHLYDQERKLRLEAENKCASCTFVKKANEEFIDRRIDEERQDAKH